MGVMSSNQLHNYDKILEKINSELEESGTLKKQIQEADDAITGLKLSIFPHRQKISHVNVKVFNNVMDISNLYESDVLLDHCDILSLSKHRDCNFLLIEVIVTKLFSDNLSNWQIDICVSAETFCINKVRCLNYKNCVFDVIPISCSIVECKVTTRLFHSSADIWNIIDLHSVNINISYYFESYKEKITAGKFSNILLDVTKVYNKNKILDCIRCPLQLQTQLNCDFNKTNFVPTFIKNSYHRLHLELFPDFISDKLVISLQFCIEDKIVTVLYNKDTNILKITCDCSHMLLIKKIVTEFSALNFSKFTRKLKSVHKRKNQLNEMDLIELLSLYQQVRNLWL